MPNSRGRRAWNARTSASDTVAVLTRPLAAIRPRQDARSDPPAFLATTARLAINVIQSARARRESHVGASVPDAVAAGADPALRVERRETLEHGASVLLEKLSPTERAAYVVREA